MTDIYYNQGWFGKHPAIYEIGSFFLGVLRRKAVRMMGSDKLRVIDIATGTGAHAYQMAKTGHDVIGIDLDQKMLDKAANKIQGLKLSFKQGDGTNLKFQDNEFDAATISYAVHDVPFEIGVKMLSEARRVVKKGGFVYLIDYNQLTTFGARFLNLIAAIYESPNYNPFVKRKFDDYLVGAGLRIEERETFLGALQIIKAGF